MTSDGHVLGPWIRRFLLEPLVLARHLARHTQHSYRDTLALLLPFVSTPCQTPLDRLLLDDLSPAIVRQLLAPLEHDRHGAVATRNQRRGALHPLARFMALPSPHHLAWYGELRTIPFKKTPQPTVGYLEQAEMEALLQAPDQQTEQGCRDYAVLLCLYNTGARATEVAV